MAAKSETCKCGGSGSYTYEEREVHGGREVMGLIGTALCNCRKQLPPRAGAARWWTEECIKGLVWESLTKLDKLHAVIMRERPVSEDNYKLLRTPENSYYPTTAVLECDFGSFGLMSTDLRALSQWLTSLADEVDRIDNEVS